MSDLGSAQYRSLTPEGIFIPHFVRICLKGFRSVRR